MSSALRCLTGICECKCVNVTSSRAILCLGLFQNVQLEKNYLNSLPFKKYNVQQQLINTKFYHTAIQRTEI